MTKRSKIKINSRRKEQSAKRKVKSVQHRQLHAQMEAKIASLEARIALLEEDGRLQASDFRLQEETSGTRLRASDLRHREEASHANPEVRSPKPEARVGVTAVVVVLILFPSPGQKGRAIFAIIAGMASPLFWLVRASPPCGSFAEKSYPHKPCDGHGLRVTMPPLPFRDRPALSLCLCVSV